MQKKSNYVNSEIHEIWRLTGLLSWTTFLALPTNLKFFLTF